MTYIFTWASCHTDRPLHAKGLCRVCYGMKRRARIALARGASYRPKMAPRIPTCHLDRPHHADGLCMSCYNKTVARKAKDRERLRVSRQRSDSQRHSRLRLALKKIKATTLDYQRELERQRFACAICGTKRDERRALAIDHCHKTNTFRGLLCTCCNLGLGYFKDNPARLRGAASYLLKRQRREQVQP